MSTANNIQITKSQVTVYRLRGLPHGNWADFTIDEGENAGRISISSDWGNWANYWGACGEPFRKFLCDLDVHYFAGKVGASRWVDADATIRQWKNNLFEERKCDGIDENEARLIYDELNEISENYDGDQLLNAAYNSNHVGKFFDYQMSAIYGIEPSFRNFWDKAYLLFVQHLKEEALNNEHG